VRGKWLFVRGKQTVKVHVETHFMFVKKKHTVETYVETCFMFVNVKQTRFLLKSCQREMHCGIIRYSLSFFLCFKDNFQCISKSFVVKLYLPLAQPDLI
jgi:hypothetical protein